METKIYMTRFVFLFTLIILWTSLEIPSTNGTSLATNQICETAVCYDVAEQLTNDMKTTVDPCQDFFQFTCGSWYTKHNSSSNHSRRFEAPSKVVRRRTQGKSFKSVLCPLKIITTEILEPDYGLKNPPVLEEAIAFYNQCKSLKLSDPNITKEIYDFIKLEKLPNLGGFPLISSDWNESDYSLEKALIYLHKDYWINAIYDTNFLYAAKDGSHGKLQISVQNPVQRYGRVFKTKETRGQMLKKNLVKLLIMPVIHTIIRNFFADQPNFNLSEEMHIQLEEAQTFTRELIQISNRELHRFTENSTIRELSTMFHDVNWTKYYMDVFGADQVNLNQTIYVNTKTLKDLSDLLSKTKKRTIANYVAIIFMINYATGFEDCTHVTRTAFRHAIGSVYAQRYLDEKMFNDTLSYIDRIRNVMEKRLNLIKWMDKAAIKSAKHKLRSISATVGYPLMYTNSDELQEYYRELNIVRGTDLKTFLKNVDILFKFQSQSEKRNRVQHRLKSQFAGGSVAINAAYFPQENDMAVFLGILNEPFYHPQRPLAMNYGSLGYIIGHELTHAFDHIGLEYDKRGKKPWWTWFYKGYKERYQCFLKQYAKIAEFEDSPTEYSRFTAMENVADAGGLMVSYEAFKELLAKDPSALERLPGELSKFTPQQLFFISFANSYCSYYPEHIKLLTKYMDSHSLDNNRIVGTIMNTKGFAEAFKCPVGSAMNPVKKCSLF